MIFFLQYWKYASHMLIFIWDAFEIIYSGLYLSLGSTTICCMKLATRFSNVSFNPFCLNLMNKALYLDGWLPRSEMPLGIG